jgi:hypothetical protein
MRVRLLALLGVALAALTVFAAQAASASASFHPAGQAGARLEDNPNSYVCQTNSEECLNLAQCNTSKGVQLWNLYNGGACTNNWFFSLAATVDPSSSFPFYCGSGLNSKYAGDTVYEFEYANGNGTYVPVSAGNDNTVTVAALGGNRNGFFVAQDMQGFFSTAYDTRLIDVTATCQNAHHYVQHLYAGCGGDGCLVRDGQNPASGGEYWDVQAPQ